MLSNSQEKLIKSLHTKKGRQKNRLCLVEGKKVIELAGDLVEYSFTPKDTKNFAKLVTTETPQALAAVARIPRWEKKDIDTSDVAVLLDGVQDPGNVGAILRLCLGFKASLVLVESADVTSPKVIRSSVGAMFQVPWIEVARSKATSFMQELNRSIYRLEKTKGAAHLDQAKIKTPLILIAGSEGAGIKLKAKGESVYIKHNAALESLNVGHALAIALHQMRQK